MTSPELTDEQVLEALELDRYDSVYATLSFLWGAPVTAPEKVRQASIARELHSLGADGIAIVNRVDDLLERFGDARYVTPRSLLAHWGSGGIIGQLRTPEDVERHLAGRYRHRPSIDGGNR